MLMVSKLKEMCEWIEREYGADSPVVIQLYDLERDELIHGDYCESISTDKSGVMFLSNHLTINLYNANKEGK